MAAIVAHRSLRKNVKTGHDRLIADHRFLLNNEIDRRDLNEV